ncbi:MAG: low molecular weight phosphotyrosine protein phosphatase [Clostridia bacterium]|nr:low molecular weight phosphotyrosine protein phosphatase [Clostridia bacterium]
MTKIMFVCHGNICRSPMAEFIFKDLAAKAGREAEFFVASSATSDETVWNGKGSRVYAPAREELAAHGISCEGKRSVRLCREDYSKYDLFVGMDSANVRNMRIMLGGDPEGKVHKLMEYTARGGDVADPWYTDRFDIAYRDIYEGCAALLENL